MKKILPLLLLLSGSVAFAQQLTFKDIVGTYQVSKLYLNDTLFYDYSNPEKSNKNILLEIGKQVPMYTNKADSTLALELFYKDIKKALGTTIYFRGDSTTYSQYKDISQHTDWYTRYVHYEKWGFNEKKQRVEIIDNGKVIDRIQAVMRNGVVTLIIDDKKERTKVELSKLY